MALSFDTTKILFARGEYVAIVEQCGLDQQRLEALAPKHQIVVAQAAFQTGDILAASEIAKHVRTLASSGELQARCEAILGLIQRRHGNWTEAQRHFQVSLQLAREARDAQQVGWSYLWLFRTLSELGPPARVQAMLGDVRTAITRAGDTHLSVYMHDSIALMEASAGRIQEARRHLRISAGLLERYPNSWLQQRFFLSTSFLDYLDSKYDDALRNLRHARDLVSTAGAGLLPIIECNEAHSLIIIGEFARAEKRLRKVADGDSPQLALGAREGLARLYLATDQLDQCESTLDACASLNVDPDLAAAFAGRWSSTTHLKLLLRTGAFQRASEEAERHLQHARQLDDKMLRTALAFLKSEALAGTGEVYGALLTLIPFGTGNAIADSGLQAAFYRAAGAVLARAGSSLCEVMFRRFLAICNAQENQSGTLEIRQFETVRTAIRADRKLKRTHVAVTVADALAAAFNLSHNPSLLGRELLLAIRTLDCAPDAALSTQAVGTGVPHVSGDSSSFSLGEHQGRELFLTYAIPRDPTKAVGLASVLRIGDAAKALQRAQEEERNRAALWPASPVEEEAGALFIAEEMQRLLATARRVAITNVSVLLTGETGTGKEILARTIHGYSSRAKASFLPFNCTSTPKEMLDSQLFGHRRGSFTGATENFQGIIRAAAGGTLFLDEIGDMALDVQPKLLRFLESNEVHPVGETHPVRVDVRVVAATNANLDALVSEGRFREDLFYRLNIVRLHLPPLRERRMEIPALAQHYLQKYAQEYMKGALRLAEETMEYLVLYRWPGNIRQLANEMRRMAALCESGAVLMPEHLSPEIAASRRTIPASERVLDPTEVVVRLDQPLAAATEHLERAIVQYALKQCGGRMEETAAMLGLSRKGLYLKRQRLGIDPPEHAAAVEVA